MKKAVMLLAGLLTVLAMGFASAQFSDVPAGHWAKEAVEKIAAEGIILGFPDGTYRGNENLTRYQAAMIIYRLLQKLQPSQMASMDKDTITALRNAVQELAAELASLGVRVSALEDNAATKGDVARLEKMIAELKAAPPANTGNASQAAATKDLADRVEAAAISADTALAQVQALQGKVDTVSAQAAANSDSIKALNELAVMLNQDVLSLQDRVTALEKNAGAPVAATAGASSADLQAVRDYVTAVRGDLVNVSNKVSALEANVGDLQDRIAPLEHSAFTISGSLALQYRSVKASGFAGYDVDRLFKSAFSSGDGNDDGQVVDGAEGLANKPGQTDATLKLKLQSGKLTGTSKGDGVNTYENAFQFSFTGKWKDPADTDGGGAFGDTIAPSLVVDKVSTTFTIAKDQCLSFVFGQSLNTKFTEYVFDNDSRSYGHGVVGTLKTGFMGFTLTGVYGNKTPIVDPDETIAGYDYFYGIRAAISPFDGFKLGGSYLMQDSAANAVWGADLSAKLGPLGLMGEYFKDSANVTSYYVKADAKFGAFSLGANYRNIGAITSATVFSNDVNGGGEQFIGKSKKNAAPFRASSNGFGVNLGAKLGIFSLSAYYDNYSLAAANTDVGSWQAYGGELGLKLAGMQLKAYYKTHSGAADSLEGAAPGQKYRAAYGANLDHPAKGAIVPGLHAYLGYDQATKSNTTDIEAYADYTNKFSIVNVELLARYHSNSAGPTTTTKFGAKLATDPLGIIFAPSFKAGYVMRGTTGGISETYWFAGLAFNKFLCDHSVLEGGYASYAGANVNMPVGMKDKAFDAATDYIYDDASAANTGTLTGWYVDWTYWDLHFNYANFSEGSNYAQAFQIKYTVNF